MQCMERLAVITGDGAGTATLTVPLVTQTIWAIVNALKITGGRTKTLETKMEDDDDANDEGA